MIGWLSQNASLQPDLDDDQCSLDRIKTDEQDAFRIAIYCEQSHKTSSRP